jgi:TolA-binding protein
VVVFCAVRTLVFLSLLLASCWAIAARQAPPDFAARYEGHHWFALRDAGESEKTSGFYRNAVEAVFNERELAEKDLRDVIRAAPHGREAYQAHTLLVGLYLRSGEYRAALVQTEALLAENPDAADAKNVLPLFRVLSETPDQTVVQRQSSAVQMQVLDGNLLVPVSMNDTAAK